MFKIAAFLIAFLISSPARALETPWAASDYVQIKLLSAVDGVGQEKQIDAALELQLAAGWHAYWRMPGDAGLAPVFDWDGSENVAGVDVLWPVPKRFAEEGLNTFGYDGRVAFPLSVKIEKPGQAVKLNLKASIMVCEKICVPQDVAVGLEISAGAAEQGRNRALIDHMRGKVPHEGDLPDLRIDSVVLGPDALVVRVWSQQGFESADLFVESGDLYLTAAPEITPDKDDPRAAFLRIKKPEGVENLAQQLAGRTIKLTLTGGGALSIEREFPF